MIWAGGVRRGNELYIYVRGQLILKKRIDACVPTILYQTCPVQAVVLPKCLQMNADDVTLESSKEKTES